MAFAEFQTEIDWWGSKADGFKSRTENEQAWKVSIEDIADRNYNLDISNPHVGETVDHDPEELLATYRQQQDEIQSVHAQLKSILATALAGNQ